MCDGYFYTAFVLTGMVRLKEGAQKLDDLHVTSVNKILDWMNQTSKCHWATSVTWCLKDMPISTDSSL